MKSALQQVQWTTDIKLGKILTKKQMEEYQNLLEAAGTRQLAQISQPAAVAEDCVAFNERHCH